MKVVAKKGDDERRVRLCHWWPGREQTSEWMIGEYTRTPSPIPFRLIDQARWQETRYMTVASANLGTTEIRTIARCCPKDQPSRATGRFIALLRLARVLRPLGYKLEKVA